MRHDRREKVRRGAVVASRRQTARHRLTRRASGRSQLRRVYFGSAKQLAAVKRELPTHPAGHPSATCVHARVGRRRGKVYPVSKGQNYQLKLYL